MLKIKTLAIKLIINYLRFFTILKLKRINPFIIGVTGSVGKSSTIYLLDCVLSRHFKVKTTYHGNSETGLPLEILNLRQELKNNSLNNWIKILFKTPIQAFKKENYTHLIAEMGVDEPDEPKNMSYLLKILKPDIGIFLSVAPVHTEQFMKVVNTKNGDIENQLLTAIAREKGLLVTTLPQDKTAVINIDSPYILNLKNQIKAKIISIGKSKETDIKLVDSTVDLNGTKYVFSIDSQKYEIFLENELLFNEFGLSIASVLAVTKTLNLKIPEVLKDLENNFNIPPGRQSLFKGKNSSLIIDSSYNSSPETLAKFVELVNGLKINGKKIAVFGDMRELGSLAQQKHQEVAKEAVKVFDYIILVGPLMHDYFLPELIKNNYDSNKVFSFKTSKDVGSFIGEKILKNSDLVLVKGSQNTIFLEEIVKDLINIKEDTSKLLCRQGTYWDRVRAKFFKDHPNQLYS